MVSSGVVVLVQVNINIESVYFLPLFCSSVCSLHLALLLRKFVLILLIPHLHPSLLHWPPSSSTVSSFFPQIFFTLMLYFHSHFPLETRNIFQTSALIMANKLTKETKPCFFLYFLIVTLFKISEFFLIFLTTTAYSKKYNGWVFKFYFNQL